MVCFEEEKRSEKSQATKIKNYSLTFCKHSWFSIFIPIEHIAIYINKLLGFPQKYFHICPNPKIPRQNMP
jgi:hypothetical protein